MALELRQNLKQVQKLMMTQQLQQAIRLLQLSRMELVETVQQELMENPMLEEADSQETDEQEVQQPKEETRSRENEDAVYDSEVSRNGDWEEYLGETASATRDSLAQREVSRDEDYYSPLMRCSGKTTLEGHLLWQLHLSDMTPEQMAIGECIIGNLSSSGYLQATLEEISALAGVETGRILPVLQRIQLFDPVGVAARDARECLLIQIKDRGLDRDPVLVGIVSNFLEDFESKRFRPVMRRYKLTEDDLKEYMFIIQTLDPMPGASFGSSEPSYVSPDAYVRKVDDEFVIVLNEEGLPRLVLSELCEQGMHTPEEKSYCARKKKEAIWIISSLDQRNKTLYKVIESIVKHQREFFEQGPRGLRPLILREIAEDIRMHESTVSRITSNKYVSTPHGTFELKYFFNSAVSLTNGSEVGSEAVKVEIKKLIQEENSENPLTDDQIVQILQKNLGIELSRRTVAKYRSVLNIPSSTKRRTLF